VSKVAATGVVSNLKKVEDFAGKFVVDTAGAVAGAGGGAAVLQNQQKVRLALTGTAQGVRFTLAKSGVEVEFKK
jgi:hypothetical protein